MCRHYGVKPATYRCRIKYGWSQERALTGKIRNNIIKVAIRDKEITDHLGNKYSSVAEMCTHYGIDRMTYTHRLQHGWSQKEALTKKVKVRNKEITDHLGNVYKSKSEMCEHYGTILQTYNSRIKRGWSKERALTTLLNSKYHYN